MSIREIVDKTITLSRIEDYLLQLGKASSDRLRVPFTPKDAGFGCDAAYAQLVITWAQENPTGVLETSLNAAGEAHEHRIRRFVKKPTGLICAAIAPKIFDLSGLDESEMFKDAIDFQIQSFRPSQPAGQLSLFPEEKDVVSEGALPDTGRKIILPSIDTRDSWKILPQLYYSKRLSDNNYAIRSQSDFQTLAKYLLKRIVDYKNESSKRSLPMSPDLVKGLGIIIHELFDNTEKWATRNAYGVLLRNSFRGILIRMQNVESLNRGADPPLEVYVKNASGDAREFAEITVIDSGPGLVARRIKRDVPPEMPISEELTELYGCLQKGSSSSRKPGRGYGLFNVISTLTDLRGFLRIRTGRLSVYRDTVTMPVRPEIAERFMDGMLRDWSSGEPAPTKMGNARGAVFTLLIPIG